MTGLSAQTTSVDPPSVAVVEARLAEIDASPGLTPDIKAALRESYRQTLAELESAARWRASVLGFGARAGGARSTLAQLTSALTEPPDRSAPPVSTLEEAEQVVSQLESELAAATSRLIDLDAEPLRRVGRRTEIRQRMAQLDEQSRLIVADLEAPRAPDELAEVATARLSGLAARRMNVENESASHRQELLAYDAEALVLPRQRDLTAREVAGLSRELQTVREQANALRRVDVSRQASTARRATQGDYARALAALVAQNARLADRRLELVDAAEEAERVRTATVGVQSVLADRFARTRERVEAIGQIPAIGLLLRNQRDNLPDVRQYRRLVEATELDARMIQTEIFDIDEQRSQLANLDTAVARVLPDLAFLFQDSEDPPDEETVARARARRVLETQREYLDLLLADLGRHFDVLVEIGIAQHEIIDQSTQFREFIDERILWTRSADRLDLEHLVAARDAAAWLAGRERWTSLGAVAWRDMTVYPLGYLLGLVALGALLRYRRKLRRMLVTAGESAERRTAFTYRQTALALALTLTIAAVGPSVVWLIGRRLAELSQTSFTLAVASALMATAVTLGPVELLRQACRAHGLALAHFGWSPRPVAYLRRQLQWLLPLTLPLVFVTVLMSTQDDLTRQDSLGRLTLMALQLGLALFFHQLLHPRRGILQALSAAHPDGWLSRLRPVWYVCGVGAPLVLGLVAAAGYVYTADQLLVRGLTSIWLIVAIAVAHGMMCRWVLVSRRRLAFRQRRDRLSLALGEPAPDQSSSTTSLPEDRHPTLQLIDARTRQLIRAVNVVAALAGLWLIWSDMIPAMGVLDRVTLWTLEGSEPGIRQPFTLEDLALTMILAMMTAVVAKNVPAVIEMSLLQRLPLQAGLRYAIASVTRYLLGFAGILVIGGVLGVTWSSVQWLVAALGVGLGFGLQEIFANFVSGIILLFERPVRVGDTVTIGDTTGTVMRIRMRATTILDWDMKELVVPNRDLVTGRLVNWTLSDSSNRITTSVGVAYGSDTARVTRVLHEIVAAQPRVLTVPEPRITFEAFGDSALTFTLRLYLSQLEDRLPVTHDLHMAIARRFEKEGIEIAFPQLDVHVRTPEPSVAGETTPSLSTRQWPSAVDAGPPES